MVGINAGLNEILLQSMPVSMESDKNLLLRTLRYHYLFKVYMPLYRLMHAQSKTELDNADAKLLSTEDFKKKKLALKKAHSVDMLPSFEEDGQPLARTVSHGKRATIHITQPLAPSPRMYTGRVRKLRSYEKLQKYKIYKTLSIPEEPEYDFCTPGLPKKVESQDSGYVGSCTVLGDPCGSCSECVVPRNKSPDKREPVPSRHLVRRQRSCPVTSNRHRPSVDLGEVKDTQKNTPEERKAENDCKASETAESVDTDNASDVTVIEKGNHALITESVGSQKPVKSEGGSSDHVNTNQDNESKGQSGYADALKTVVNMCCDLCKCSDNMVKSSDNISLEGNLNNNVIDNCCSKCVSYVGDKSDESALRSQSEPSICKPKVPGYNLYNQNYRKAKKPPDVEKDIVAGTQKSKTLSKQMSADPVTLKSKDLSLRGKSPKERGQLQHADQCIMPVSKGQGCGKCHPSQRANHQFSKLDSMACKECFRAHCQSHSYSVCDFEVRTRLSGQTIVCTRRSKTNLLLRRSQSQGSNNLTHSRAQRFQSCYRSPLESHHSACFSSFQARKNDREEILRKLAMAPEEDSSVFAGDRPLKKSNIQVK